MARRSQTSPGSISPTQPRRRLGVLERLLGGPQQPRQLFCRNYPAIREALEHFHELGVLLLLFSRRGQLIAGHWVDAVPDKPHAALIGRHGRCDLVVPARYSELSLRHLAVLVRAVGVDEVTLRIIDLHTELGFADESGRSLRAIEAQGPVFVRLGELTLAALVTGDSAPIAGDANDAFDCIPPRVFLRERSTSPGALIRGRVERDLLSGCTRVHQRPAALPLGQLPATSREQIGTLWIESKRGFSCRPLRAIDLARGILIGRYERCDVIGGNIVDHRLSRVHLLLIADGSELFAVDTASSNGSRLKQRPIALVHFDPGTTLVLGDTVKIFWRRG